MNNQKPNSRMHYGLMTMASLCRGNTLVPIIIALSISSVATIAFVKQGADLSEKQKQINASKEAFEYLQEWINLRKQKQFLNQITPDELSFHNTQNVLGYWVKYEYKTASKSGILYYPTASPSHCIQIKSIFEKHDVFKDSTNKRRIYCINGYLKFEFSR